ncbi:MAG: 30S ribosome-binding factor RbfA [Oscillospiraceae bacterium]|nr:30S ribosome-binding factor RbfA [Oscillospiraceae bacterium]MDD6527576.1 30S ribosome-binding factor RbfA [Oscillospiraceae bacterium]
MAGYRVSRVSEDIRREITAIVRELKDPRVAGKMLTVVRVEVSSDASFAKVFISDFGGIENAKEAVKGLAAATGYIRREVGQRLHLRKTPELKFVADDSVERGFNMFKKLDEAENRSEKTDAD